MLKLVHCVRKKPGMGLEQFREAWKDYGQRLQTDLGPLGATRISVSTTLEIDFNRQLQESRGSLTPFDGVAEIWFSSGGRAQQLLEREDFRRQIDELQHWRASFVDVPASCFFFVFEETNIDLESE